MRGFFCRLWYYMHGRVHSRRALRLFWVRGPLNTQATPATSEATVHPDPGGVVFVTRPHGYPGIGGNTGIQGIPGNTGIEGIRLGIH